MIECKGAKGTFFDDKAAQNYGLKLMGNYNISMNKINVLQAGFHN